MFQTVRRAYLASALAVACAWPGLTAHAVPFNAAITINGSVSLDTAGSTTSSGNASQSGSLSVTAGGALTSSTFTELTVAGSNPIAQGLTDIGDGLGINFVVVGTFDGADATNNFLIGNYAISLSNSSATATYEISLAVAFLTQDLNAAGVNAFVTGWFFINDAAFNQIVFGEQTLDTFFGDVDTPLSPTSFLVSLAPGQSAAFGGQLRVMGGVFDDTGMYGGDFDARISIAGVREIGGAQAVPEPGTLALVALGFLAIRRGGRSGHLLRLWA